MFNNKSADVTLRYYLHTSERWTMNPILEMLNKHNINNQQINDLFETLTQNPLAAMANIGQLGLPQDQLQLLMGQIMQNPQLIKEAVEELGLDFSKVEQAKNKLQQ